MKLKLVGVLLLLATSCLGQNREKIKTNYLREVKVKSHVNGRKTKVKTDAPGWAFERGYKNNIPVYFPDLYAFYDPVRGYVYWDNGAWATSPEIPFYLLPIDFAKARMEVLTGMRLGERPELKYITYVKQYPPGTAEIPVHVPEIKVP